MLDCVIIVLPCTISNNISWHKNLQTKLSNYLHWNNLKKIQNLWFLHLREMKPERAKALAFTPCLYLMSLDSFSKSFLPCELDQHRPVPFCVCSSQTPCGDVRLCLVYRTHSPELQAYLQYILSLLCRPCRFVTIWKQLFSPDLAFLAPTQLLAGTLGFIVRAPQRNSYLEIWNHIQKAKTYLSAECARIFFPCQNCFIWIWPIHFPVM